ncbi:MAG: hypothetical protein ACXWC4_06335 [Telluria sp.]
MDKDLLKGLAMIVAVVIALGVVFWFGARSGPQKASCIARAIKDGVPYAKIDTMCSLTERSY